MHSHQGHSHNHSPGGHTHHPGCSHGQSQHHQVDPQEYFQQLKALKNKNKEFYWNEVLKGAALAKYLEYYGLGFLNGLSLQMIVQSVVGMAHMMVTCDWMPLTVRPFVSGLFWPFLLYVFMNYKIITGISGNNQGDASVNESTTGNGSQAVDRSVITLLFIAPILLYILVGLRGSGNLSTENTKKIAQKIYEVRPYLQNPSMSCRVCSIPKIFRAAHCPMCKICVPKFSRHSLAFGVCIGAGNQLLALLFFLSVTILSGYCLVKIILLRSLFGIITLLILNTVNNLICWMSFVQFSTFLIMNFNFGITEHEVQNWMMLQYLMRVPAREFMNSCNNGLMHAFVESGFAMMGISGFEAELYDGRKDAQERENEPLREEIGVSESSALGFPEVQDGIKYVVNWAKAIMVVIPQMPNNPIRKDIIKLMKTDQPKMISKFKLLKKFQQQAKKQNPQLSQFQLQQKAMLKMSQHMSKNPELMNSMRPPPEQQRAIQLQMLGHMKMQFQSEPELFREFGELEASLREMKVTVEEAGMRMRGLQQKVMEKKMKQIMEAQKKQAESQSQPQSQQGSQSQLQPQQTSLQSAMQAQLRQKLQQRQKQLSIVTTKQEPKKPAEKEQESDQLKEQEHVDDQNL